MSDKIGNSVGPKVRQLQNLVIGFPGVWSVCCHCLSTCQQKMFQHRFKLLSFLLSLLIFALEVSKYCKLYPSLTTKLLMADFRFCKSGPEQRKHEFFRTFVIMVRQVHLRCDNIFYLSDQMSGRIFQLSERLQNCWSCLLYGQFICFVGRTIVLHFVQSLQRFIS